MKTLFAILLMASAAFAQATVKYEQAHVTCSNSFLEAYSCIPQIKVTIHPADPKSIAAFAVVVYKSIAFGDSVVQAHVSTTKDEHGDFVVMFPSGDMSNPIISAVEAEQLVSATQ